MCIRDNWGTRQLKNKPVKFREPSVKSNSENYTLDTYNYTMSTQQKHLLSIFNMNDHEKLPPDLCYIILQFSGLVKIGSRGSCVFILHIPRFIGFPNRKKNRALIKKV